MIEVWPWLLETTMESTTGGNPLDQQHAREKHEDVWLEGVVRGFVDVVGVYAWQIYLTNIIYHC